MSRSFTEAEILEVEGLTARGFEDRATPDDGPRFQVLHQINPDQYGEIGRQVRRVIQDRLRNFSL